MHLLARRREYDVVFCWFGDIYATLAVRASRLLGKRVIVVAGGFDTTSIPSVGYGLLADERKRNRAYIAFSSADRVLVVDESLKEALERGLHIDSAHIDVLHTGYDPEVFRPAGLKEAKTVLTVATVTSQTIKVKGLGTFVAVARQLPDFNFRIVGPLQDSSAIALRSGAPSNVEFAGEISHGNMPREYQRAQIYAQLSIAEGLPNSLAEAMLCECVPIGTPIGGIPTLIGDCGFYVPPGDPVATAECITRAATSTKGPEARQRIATAFHIDKRDRALQDIITELCKR